MASSKNFLRYQSRYIHLVYFRHMNSEELKAVFAAKDLEQIGIYLSYDTNNPISQVFLIFEKPFDLKYYKQEDGLNIVKNPDYITVGQRVHIETHYSSQRGSFETIVQNLINTFVNEKTYYNAIEGLAQNQFLVVKPKSLYYFEKLPNNFFKNYSQDVILEIKSGFTDFVLDFYRRQKIIEKLSLAFSKYDRVWYQTLNDRLQNIQNSDEEEAFDTFNNFQNNDEIKLEADEIDYEIEDQIEDQIDYEIEDQSESQFILKDNSIENQNDQVKTLTTLKTNQNFLDSAEFEQIIVEDLVKQDNFTKILSNEKSQIKAKLIEICEKNNIKILGNKTKNMLRIIAMEVDLKSFPKSGDRLKWLNKIFNELPKNLQDKYGQYKFEA